MRHWVYELGDAYTLTVNGTGEKVESLPPWSAMVSHNGWPITLFDVADGTQVGQDGEERALAAIERAIVAASVPPTAKEK